jgi:hypothetical protein
MAFDSHFPPIKPGPPFLHEVIGKIKSGIDDLGLGLDGIHNSYDIASLTRIPELCILESRDRDTACCRRYPLMIDNS